MNESEKEFLMGRKNTEGGKEQKKKPGQERGKLVIEGTEITEEEYKKSHKEIFGDEPKKHFEKKHDKLN